MIADQLGPDLDDNSSACSLNCEECEHRWNCEFACSLEWSPEEFDFTHDGEGQVFGSDDEIEFGSVPQADQAFVNLRQAAIGWCNIYAVILPRAQRAYGLQILFYIGRSLANLGYSIDDGIYENPQASIAFSKRSLTQLNRAIGELNRMIDERPRLSKILKTIRQHLLKANEGVQDHLQNCRESQSGPNG